MLTFDTKKTIEDLKTYRDGLKQQLEMLDKTIDMLEGYQKLATPAFEMLQHNPAFQLATTAWAEYQKFFSKEQK